MALRSDHFSYLKERGANPERLTDRYKTVGDDLCIFYCDANGDPYKDSQGNKYFVRRPLSGRNSACFSWCLGLLK